MVDPAILRKRRSDRLGWADKAYRADYAWDFITNQTRWAGANIGALANTPNWTFTRASTAYYCNSAGVLTSVASGVLRTGDRGALIEGAGTNKCTNYNANPTDLTNVVKSGDAASTLSVVDDTAALVAAGLSQICSSGQVYKLDNSAGVGTADAIFGGTVANTNGHVVSCYVRGSGDAAVGIQNGTVSLVTQSADYVRRSLTGIVPDTSARQMRIRVAAGAVVYFILNQLEESSFVSSPIVVAGASATRAADSLTVTGVSGLDYPLTLYAEFERAADKGAAESHFGVSNTTNDYALLRTSSGDLSQGAVVTGGASQGFPAVGSPAMVVGTAYKHAMRVATNDLQIALNGTLGTPDASSTNPAAPTMIEFGSLGGSYGYAYLRRLAIFSRALSDGELQVQTS